MDVIELAGVSKKYHLYDAPGDRLREFFSPGRRRFHREHWAIRDVSVTVRKGETFCIVGENGSGKSTLLKLMVGILSADHGAGGDSRPHQPRPSCRRPFKRSPIVCRPS